MTAIAAHDITSILAHIAVFIPRSFFLLLFWFLNFFAFIGLLLLLLLPWCLLRTALLLFRVVVGLLRFGVIFLRDHLAVFLNDNLSGSASPSPRLNSTSLHWLRSLLFAGCDGFLGAASRASGTT